MGCLLNKIRATTLVETLVAMTLLSLVSGLAMIIFMQISAPASSTGFLLAAQQRSAEMLDTLQPGYLERQQDVFIEISAGPLYYQGRIDAYTDEVVQVEMNVTDNNNRQIYQRRRLYYLHETN